MKVIMQKILIATQNPGKFNEIVAILDHDLPFEFHFLGDTGLKEEDLANFVEDGVTHDRDVDAGRGFWNWG